MGFYESLLTGLLLTGALMMAIRLLAPTLFQSWNLIYSILGMVMILFITVNLLGFIFGIQWTPKALDLNGILLGILAALGLTSAVKTIYQRYQQKLGKS